jgi:hypothetical protein
MRVCRPMFRTLPDNAAVDRHRMYMASVVSGRTPVNVHCDHCVCARGASCTNVAHASDESAPPVSGNGPHMVLDGRYESAACGGCSLEAGAAQSVAWS